MVPPAVHGRIVEQAMHQFGYSVKPAVAVKAQAIEVIRFLKSVGMPIERASMKFAVDYKEAEGRAAVKQWVRNHSHRILTRVAVAWYLRHRLKDGLADEVAKWVPVTADTYELSWVVTEGESQSPDGETFNIVFAFPPHLYNRVERLVKETNGTIAGMDLRWAERDDICISELVIPKHRVSFKSSSEDEGGDEVELRQRRKLKDERRAQEKRRAQTERRKGHDEEPAEVEAPRGRKGKAEAVLDEETIERLRQEAEKEETDGAPKKGRKKPKPPPRPANPSSPGEEPKKPKKKRRRRMRTMSPHHQMKSSKTSCFRKASVARKSTASADKTLLTQKYSTLTAMLTTRSIYNSTRPRMTTATPRPPSPPPGPSRRLLQSPKPPHRVRITAILPPMARQSILPARPQPSPQTVSLLPLHPPMTTHRHPLPSTPKYSFDLGTANPFGKSPRKKKQKKNQKT
eukprot:TRINITY_DN10977_c0_g1_i1.p1 TRINITY_DN10977_c0_g1~~TRINITY_DN10977_c0_g1_i1.p1  ORF type:complete len:458 (-),score=96.38 TRINITY_DN10977_c0_g1_i1:5-1378(-)